MDTQVVENMNLQIRVLRVDHPIAANAMERLNSGMKWLIAEVV